MMSADWKKMAGGAAAVFVIGKAFNLPPVGPDDAALVRPLAGVVLALLLTYGARLWPGLFIGLAAFHLSSGTGPWETMGLLGRIGGDLAQGLAGYWIVRRAVQDAGSFEEANSLWKFACLALVIGMISPSIQGGLHAFVSTSSLSSAAMTWVKGWVGESLWLLLVTPVLCVWLGRHPWEWRGRPLVVALPIAGSFAITWALYGLAMRSENALLWDNFSRDANTIAAGIQTRLNDLEERFDFIERFYAGSEFVSRTEFEVFLSSFHREQPHVEIQWAPRVPQGERPSYEKRWGTTYGIVEWTNRPDPQPAGQREDYFPATYIVPAAGEKHWAGYDWASNPVVRELIDKVEKTARGAGTLMILPHRWKTPERYFLILTPVFKKARPPKGTPAPPLAGVLIGTVRAEFLLEELIKNEKMQGVDFEVAVEPIAPRTSHRFVIEKSFELLGQRWFLRTALDPEFIRRQKSWTVPAIFVGGLVFASVLGAFALLVTGRTLRIAALVEERTSELQRANVELNRHMVEKEGVERMKRDFISSVSHELRTPLTSIKGYMSILLRDPAMPEPLRREFMGIIDEEADRLTYLVEDLLEISRLEAGSVKITVEKVDLVHLAETIIKSVRPIAAKKKLRLEVDVPPDLGPLDAHPGKLRSLLTNLISNALKFTLEEGGAVALRIVGDSTTVTLQVSDSGIGIPKEDLPKIFDRFYRVERQGIQVQGTGLGLAIAKRIVDLHHGEISVQSELGKGTTFTIRLPRVYAHDSQGGANLDSTNI